MQNITLKLLACLALLLIALPAAADSLGTIKEQGFVRFSMSGQYPPFNFVNDSNQLDGFDVAAVDRLGRHYRRFAGREIRTDLR